MKKLAIALCVLSGCMLTACGDECDKDCAKADCNCDSCENKGGYCGNGNIELGEQCDGVNFAAATCATVVGPGCTGYLTCSACKVDTSHCACPEPETKLCGNGKLDAGEQCDKDDFGTATCESMKPGTTGKLQCKADCMLDLTGCVQAEPSDPVCGNGVIDSGEQCDDGNKVNGDGCSADCKTEEVPQCGNGVIDSGEQCDDGNKVNGDGCSADCQTEEVPQCGNGVIDSGEQCDKNNFGGYTCRIKCAEAGMNYSGAFACTDQCTVDESACKCISSETAICGNGEVETGEDCDDGNVKDGDGCSKNCKNEVCGNGVLDFGEDCDDGNTADGDCCSSACKFEHSAACDGTCGNGIIEFGETCDKNNLGYYTGMGAEKVCELFGYQMTSSAKVSCSDACQIVLDCPVLKCGNGVLDDGEFCDGDVIRNGYTSQSIFGPGSEGTLKCDDTCLHTDKSDCTAPSNCGNGKVNGNEKCDPKLEDESKFLCSSYYPGSTGNRVCGSVCRWEDDSCTSPPTCGNNTWDEGEDCDPSVFVSYAQSCAGEMGPGSTGTVICNERCKFSYALCTQSPACGNNKTENGTNGSAR
ncbi:MAG: DUF4215 domain-containing protein, partial [Proteobacteria bacterium]|nr:DUF4215 domain-containing protein [Pseudomonadota bacterium]